jgi:hypothetical protein
MRALFRFVARNPWIFIVLAFLLLIAAWVVTYLLAARLPSQTLPAGPPARHAPPPS